VASLSSHDTTILVRTRVSPFNSLIVRLFCKPIVTLDGIEYLRPWGMQSFDVVPGEHTVEVAFNALWMARASAIRVDVHPGEAVKVTYWTPLFPFGKGRIRAPGGTHAVSRGPSTTHPPVEPAPLQLSGTPGIGVHAWHGPANVFVQFVSVSVQINGEVRKIKWGDTFFPVPPGRYEVQIWCRWFFSKLGLSTVTIDVAPGKVSKIVWKVPGSTFGKGEITQST
jgi:hypothetical protein